MIVSNILSFKMNYDQNNAALMIGAGLSLNAVNKTGQESTFKNWDSVVRGMASDTWADDSEQDLNEKLKLGNLVLVDIIAEKVGDENYHKLLRKHIPDEQHVPSVMHYELMNLNWSEIFTTNQDTLVERSIKFAVNGEKSGRNSIAVWSNESFSKSTKNKNVIPVYKIHGCIEHPESIVFAEKQYLMYKNEMPFLDMHLRVSLCRRSFLYIGFGLSDPNFKSMLQFVLSHNDTDNLPVSYAIMYGSVDKHIVEYWRKKNLVIISFDSHRYVERVLLLIELLKLNTRSLLKNHEYRLVELRFLMKQAQENNIAIDHEFMQGFDLYYFNSIMREPAVVMRIADIFILLTSILFGEEAHEFGIPSDLDIELTTLEMNLLSYAYYQGKVLEVDFDRLNCKATWNDFLLILRRYMPVNQLSELDNDFVTYQDFYDQLPKIIDPWTENWIKNIKNDMREHLSDDLVDNILRSMEKLVEEMYK